MLRWCWVGTAMWVSAAVVAAAAAAAAAAVAAAATVALLLLLQGCGIEVGALLRLDISYNAKEKKRDDIWLTRLFVCVIER